MSGKAVKILGINIFSASKEDALEEVRKWLKSGGKKRFIVTPNPEILVRAYGEKDFAQILNQADLALPDGTGIVWAAKFLGKKIRERITGVDFMEDLCKIAPKEGFTIGLIGGGPGLAVKTAECLQKKYPGLKVVLAAEEWKNLAMKQWNNETIDFLFVAFGAPKQEIWISQNLASLPIKVAMGVGGAFDYLSGVIPRAPKWLQNLGLEWLYRLIRQPWRIKRQFALGKFVLLVLKEKAGF